MAPYSWSRDQDSKPERAQAIMAVAYAEPTECVVIDALGEVPPRPTRAEPSRAKASRAKTSRAKTSRAKTSRARIHDTAGGRMDACADLNNAY